MITVETVTCESLQITLFHIQKTFSRVGRNTRMLETWLLLFKNNYLLKTQRTMEYFLFATFTCLHPLKNIKM